jgi:hypothetical protein
MFPMLEEGLREGDVDGGRRVLRKMWSGGRTELICLRDVGAKSGDRPQYAT